MLLTILGDVHGQWDDLHFQMKQNPNTEVFLSVGDFGILQGLSSFPPKEGFDRPIYFIDGNHENHWWLKKRVEKNELEIVPNLFYIPRATHMKFGNTTFNFMGGALSIDKGVRRIGIDWFPEEIPSQKEIYDFIDLPEADIWVTHTAPTFVIEDVAHYKVEDPVSDAYNQIYNMPHLKKPKKHFFGHFHFHYNREIQGTRFICVPCVHNTWHWAMDKSGRQEKIKGYKGYTIEC